MRISHKYKFIYIAVTKTGSTTLRHLLNKYSDIKSKNDQGEFRHHAKAEELKRTFQEKGWSWDDYFKFTVVRNPVSRLHSIYKYKVRIGSKPPSDYFKKFAMNFYLNCAQFKELNISFEDAVLYDKIHIPSQTSWLMSADKKLLLNKFIKIENIRDELPHIWRHLGLPPSELKMIPDLNQSPSDVSWNSLLSVAAINKIRSAYSEDFELLGY